MLNVGGDYPF